MRISAYIWIVAVEYNKSMAEDVCRVSEVELAYALFSARPTSAEMAADTIRGLFCDGESELMRQGIIGPARRGATSSEPPVHTSVTLNVTEAIAPTLSQAADHKQCL